MSIKFSDAYVNKCLSYWLEDVLCRYKPQGRVSVKNVVFIMFEKTENIGRDRRVAIIMNKKIKHFKIDYKCKLNMSFPGGTIEPNESPFDAAKREFAEEFFKTKDNMFTSDNFRLITNFRYVSTMIFVGEYDFASKIPHKKYQEFYDEIGGSKLITIKKLIKTLCTGIYDIKKNIYVRACAKISMQDILGNYLIDAVLELNMFNDLMLWDYKMLRIRKKMNKNKWELLVKNITQKKILCYKKE